MPQQSRLMSTAIARFSNTKKSNVVFGIASSLLVPTASVALCEEKDKGFLDAIVQKDKDGNIDYAGSIGQVTGPEFWDKVAKASGGKVSSRCGPVSHLSFLYNATYFSLLKNIHLKIQNAYDTGIPSQLSYGFVCGYCSGYALKVVGKGAAVVFGTQ